VVSFVSIVAPRGHAGKGVPLPTARGRAKWPTLVAQESIITLSVSAAVLVAMAMLEHAFPERPQRLGWRRWPSNFGLVAAPTALLRVVAPAGAVGIALWAGSRGYGGVPGTRRAVVGGRARRSAAA
jgi:hypothetical protein